jgi:hypothetical protein
MPGVTQGDKIVGIPDQNRRVGCRYPGVNAGLLVPDPGGLFHPVQSNVQQQRTCYPTLRSSLLGRGEPTVLDHTRLEPAGDESPGWERAELAEQVIMINAVERRRQVSVERPPPPGVRAPGDVEDGVDRVVAATARVSRRGESHPPPLSGPDVTISRHPAPTVRPEVVRVMRCQ